MVSHFPKYLASYKTGNYGMSYSTLGFGFTRITYGIFQGFQLPDRTFLKFRVLKSVERRFYATESSTFSATKL